MKLSTKTAIVTGAAGGLGAAMVELFLSEGANVVATDIVTEEQAHGIHALKGKGELRFVQHDVSQPDDWDKVMDFAISEFGGLDVLVNNAGVEFAALIADHTFDEYKKIMSVNSDGVFLGIRAGVKTMSQHKKEGVGQSIINMSSIAGNVGVPGFIAYGASKGAVRSMTKHSAVECARLGTGIRINSIHPGVVNTNIATNVFDEFVTMGLAESAQTAEQSLIEGHPLGRLGDPIDVAKMAVFLASDDSPWVTGSEFVVDGGYMAA